MPFFFFLLPYPISRRHLHLGGGGCVRGRELRTNPPTGISSTFNMPARLFRKPPGEGVPRRARVIVVIYFADFSREMYAELSDSVADTRDFET